jgi:hypothetical protein
MPYRCMSYTFPSSEGSGYAQLQSRELFDRYAAEAYPNGGVL